MIAAISIGSWNLSSFMSTVHIKLYEFQFMLYGESRISVSHQSIISWLHNNQSKCRSSSSRNNRSMTKYPKLSDQSNWRSKRDSLGHLPINTKLMYYSGLPQWEAIKESCTTWWSKVNNRVLYENHLGVKLKKRITSTCMKFKLAMCANFSSDSLH